MIVIENNTAYNKETEIKVSIDIEESNVIKKVALWDIYGYENRDYSLLIWNMDDIRETMFSDQNPYSYDAYITNIKDEDINSYLTMEEELNIILKKIRKEDNNFTNYDEIISEYLESKNFKDFNLQDSNKWMEIEDRIVFQIDDNRNIIVTNMLDVEPEPYRIYSYSDGSNCKDIVLGDFSEQILEIGDTIYEYTIDFNGKKYQLDDFGDIYTEYFRIDGFRIDGLNKINKINGYEENEMYLLFQDPMSFDDICKGKIITREELNQEIIKKLFKSKI